MEKDSPIGKVLGKNRPLVIGHRGFSHFAPENTLPSFDLAIAAGVDLVEFDCHQTKDGELVVIHDQELRRTTNAGQVWRRRGMKIRSRTVHELLQLDAGSWFDRQFSGVRIPTLAQALERITPRSIALIERKSGDPNAIVQLIKKQQVLNRVVVQSFDWAFLYTIHHLAPDLALGALGPPGRLSHGRKPRAVFRRLSKAWLRELQKTGARLAVWNQQVSAKAVKQAHEQGTKVWVYTVNTRKGTRRLVRMGVDGFISDNPALIWKELGLIPGSH